MSIPAEDRVAELRRWDLFGGTWRTLSRTESAGTVALCRCDGGEEVRRITSTDPAFLALIDQAP